MRWVVGRRVSAVQRRLMGIMFERTGFGVANSHALGALQAESASAGLLHAHRCCSFTQD